LARGCKAAGGLEEPLPDAAGAAAAKHREIKTPAPITTPAATHAAMIVEVFTPPPFLVVAFFLLLLLLLLPPPRPLDGDAGAARVFALVGLALGDGGGEAFGFGFGLGLAPAAGAIAGGGMCSASWRSWKKPRPTLSSSFVIAAPTARRTA
jgi:hypothetical protein